MSYISEDGKIAIEIKDDPTKEPWWAPDVKKILKPATAQMLKTYAGVPEQDQVKHIEEARVRAYAASPFASVGALTWLDSYMLLHPAYNEVIKRVKNGEAILDCGCMVAPDLRQLAYDGAPTDNMVGFDLEPAFFDIGFDFYNDRQTWKGKFFQVNALEPLAPEVASLQVDIIWCAKFVHLFDREGQINMVIKLLSLLKPTKGAMFLGSQNGYPGGIEIEVPAKDKGMASLDDKFLLADVEDIEAMWNEVEWRTGSQWDVKTKLLDLRTIGWHEDDGSPYKRTTGYNIQWTAVRK